MIKRLSRTTCLGVMMLMVLVITAMSCSDSNDKNTTNNVIGNDQLQRQKEVIQQLGQGVFLPAYEDFAQKAVALESATKAWSETPTEANRVLAQTAWTDAMLSWQRVEVYQVGPLGIMGEVAGGKDLRDEIYSWPLVNACRIDQEIVADRFGDPDTFKAQLANVRGLDALSYLIHNTGTKNACSINAGINKDGDWATLDADTLAQRRARYAYTLSILIKGRADELVTAWKGGFLDTLNTANNDVYPSYQEALNSVSDAMFYVEKESKDMKLGWPASITKNCEGDACLEELELKHSRVNKASILSNLRAFQTVYLGNVEGEEAKPGFDDLLKGVNAAELDTQMQEKITAAIKAVEAINGTLYDALNANDPKVQVAYDALKALTDLMRTQFISVLDLELPKRAEGDND